MTEGDLDYYKRRAREEAGAAVSSSSAAASIAHRSLALEYEARVHELQTRERQRQK